MLRGWMTKLACVVILLLWSVQWAAGSADDKYTSVAAFDRGTDEEVLRPWSVPEPFRSSVTRLALAVMLIRDGTARVLRMDHDVRAKPAEARVCLDASRSAFATGDFHSLSIRYRGLKYHTNFRVALLDPAGREVVGPVLGAGPDHWRTDELGPADFTWPEPKPKKLSGLALVVRKEDENGKGTLLLQWIRRR